MTSTRLSFVKTVTGGEAIVRDLWGQFFPRGKYVLNRTQWRGKEPRSCAVTRISSGEHSIGDATFPVDVEVTYRAKGHISYVGQTKYDGWDAMVIQRDASGALVGADGQPLKEGQPALYRPAAVHNEAEFNELDFGEFVSEQVIEALTQTTRDDVFKEILASGSFSSSTKSTFIAPHRSRPSRKIILSNAPTGQTYDGFGTHILNINISTPNLEHILMEQLTTLMCEFIEGKASINCIGNDQLTFVQLSDSLVDCEPNEMGEDSWFGVMNSYTPIGFLEDLAKRINSVYAIAVSVIPGKDGGLVLRQESKDE